MPFAEPGLWCKERIHTLIICTDNFSCPSQTPFTDCYSSLLKLFSLFKIASSNFINTISKHTCCSFINSFSNWEVLSYNFILQEFLFLLGCIAHFWPGSAPAGLELPFCRSPGKVRNVSLQELEVFLYRRNVFFSITSHPDSDFESPALPKDLSKGLLLPLCCQVWVRWTLWNRIKHPGELYLYLLLI